MGDVNILKEKNHEKPRCS